MSESYQWCEACNKEHRSREECPNGWKRSFFAGKYVSPENFIQEVLNLRNLLGKD